MIIRQKEPANLEMPFSALNGLPSNEWPTIAGGTGLSMARDGAQLVCDGFDQMAAAHHCHRHMQTRLMKKVLIVIFAFISPPVTFSAERFDAVTWHGLRIYDVASLKAVEELQIGKVVGVRFNYRSTRLRHIKPGWYEASLWQRNPKEKSGFSYLRVFVAKKDLPAFEAFPTDFKSSAPLIVYGQVQKDADANYSFVRLIGGRVALDRARNATVNW